MNIGLVIFLFVNLLITALLGILVAVLWKKVHAQSSEIDLFVLESISCNNLNFQAIHDLGEKNTNLALESSKAMWNLHEVNKGFIDYFRVIEDRIRILEGRPTLYDDQLYTDINDNEDGETYLGDII